MKKTLGILGGMGAAAGVHMADRLVKLVQMSKFNISDSEFPDFMLYNLPIRDFDETGIKDAFSVLRQLESAIERMNAFGCDYVLMACNTAHVFWDQLQSKSKGRVLHMIEIVADDLKGKKSVGVLCSRTSRELYQKSLAARGIETKFVREDDQNWIDEAIKNAIVNQISRKDSFSMEHCAYCFDKEGCEVVLVACTELPLVPLYTDISEVTSIPLIDVGETAIKYALTLIQ